MSDIDVSATSMKKSLLDVNTGRKVLLTVLLGMTLFASACGLWPATSFYWRFQDLATTPIRWTALFLSSFVIFNYGYLIGLLAIRMVIPKPKEGFYPVSADGRPPRGAVLYMANLLLAKMRYHAPWVRLFLEVIANLPPMAGLYSRYFGPKTGSMTLGDTLRLYDPYLVTIGKRVQFGSAASISCHGFDSRGLLIKGVVIEDDATIGSESFLGPGVHVGHHATVGVLAFVKPNTVIGPYEYWAGIPARLIKTMEPEEFRKGAMGGAREVAPTVQLAASRAWGSKEAAAREANFVKVPT